MVNQSGGEAEDVVIHTMRDDVAGAPPPRVAPSVAKPAPAPPSIPGPRFQAPVSPPVPPRPTPAPKPPAKPVPAPALSQQFPLPPRTSTPASPVAAQEPRTPQPPPAFIPRRRRRRPILWATVFILVVGAAAAGAYAYFFWLVPQAAQPIATPAAPAALDDIIPASADVVVRYRIPSPDVRGQLLELWQGSTKPLLQGNPASLLASGSLTEFAYVMLADNSRPFLLVPKDTLPSDIVATLSQAQIEEFSGWHVVHGLSAAPFREAVQAGTQTLAAPAGISPDRGLEISLNQAALNQLRNHIASPSFSAGLLTSVTVTAYPSPSGKSLRFSGASRLPASPTPAVAPSQSDQSLLEQIPADATFVRLGASLQQDVATWQTLANILDSRVLAVPAVAALLQQFETPYAYYHRSGLDGVNDVGLIAEIPATLSPPLTLGDPTLEQALTALLPLITTSPPAAALRFAEGVYQDTPLRFVNLAGTTEALDYALPADHILVSTSKEGMFALLDTTAQLLTDTSTPNNFATEAPWAELLVEWQIVPEAEHLVFGRIQYTALLDMLPVAASDLPFGLAATPSASGQVLDGVLLLPPSAAPSESTISPQPSP